MTSITLGTWRPHPNQEDLAVIGSVEVLELATLMVSGRKLAAGRAGLWLAHLGGILQLSCCFK
jgi:hypothetical protein